MLELGVLFIGAPLIMSWLIFGYRVPLFLALQPVLIGFVLYLLWDDSFHMKAELAGGFSYAQLAGILVLFALAALVAGELVRTHLPEVYLGLPRRRPWVWQLVMIAYPLASVIAQELVFRTFFFHRYGPLFGEAVWLAILVNGLLFGFAHIIFGNWVAVAGTTALGVLLAWRYTATRSFWAVWLEHTLYGWLVFTVGLGRFFFTGVSNI